MDVIKIESNRGVYPDMGGIVFTPKPYSSAWVSLMETQFPVTMESLLMQYFTDHIQRGKKQMIVYVLVHYFGVVDVTVHNVMNYVYCVAGADEECWYLSVKVNGWEQGGWVLTFKHKPISDCSSAQIYAFNDNTLKFFMDVRSPIEIPKQK